MPENAIEVKNLAVSLGGKQILQDVSFEVEEGRCLALLGPSGSGKTTILRTVAGFVRPDAGTIDMFGSAMAGMPPERRPVSMLFQKPPLFDERTVEENALFGLLRREPLLKARQRVKQLAEIFDLEQFLKQAVRTLSGGERQRAAFIRAFANAKQIMLLDEPIHSAFDLHQRRVLLAALKECARKENLTTILVTHDYDEAAYLAEMVIVLTNGKSSRNTLREMYEAPSNLNVARILGYGNQVEAQVVLDRDRLAQECPVTISGTVKRCQSAAWAFFRPESVEVIEGGMGFTVMSVIFGGVFSRVVLRTQYGNGLIEAVVREGATFSVDEVVGASIAADRIMFFERDGRRASE